MSALVWPLTSYTVSSPYGPRAGGFHYGVDLAAPMDTPIYAAGDGVVMAAGSASGFGDWIILDHIINGQKVSTVYGHEYPSGLLVHTGQTVKQGDRIGLVGANGQATGPHCHFEVWPGGRLTGGHAVDPSTMVGGTVGTPGSVAVENVSTSDTPVNGPLSGIPGYSAVTSTYNFLKFGTDPHNWWRVFLFLIGLAVGAYVLWIAMKGSK